MNLTIRQQIIIWMVMLVALSSVISIGSIIYLGDRTAASSHQAELSDRVTKANLLVDSWYTDIENETRMFSDLLSGRIEQLEGAALMSGIREEIYFMVQQRQIVTRISLIDSQTGEVLISSEPAEEGKIRTALTNYNQNNHSIQISEVQRVILEKDLFVQAINPILKQGDIWNLLEIDYDISGLAASLEIMKSGETGETYAVNRFGYLISHLRHIEDDQTNKRISSTAISDCIKNYHGQGKYIDYRGQLVYGEYSWNNQAQVCLISEIDLSEVRASYVSMAKLMALIGLLMIVLVALSTYVIVSALTDGLDRLREAAEQFIKGNYNTKVEVSGSDEIGKIAKVFNQLLSQFIHSKDELTQLVHERTRELEQALQDINKERNIFQRVFERSVDALVTFSGMTILSVNQAAVELFGFQSDTELIKFGILGISASTQPNGQDSAEMAQHYIERTRKNGQESFEWLCLRADGSTFLVEALLILLKDGEEEVMQATVRDLTKQRQDKKKLQNIDRLKSRFINSLTHVMRTPLNRIRWVLEGIATGDFSSSNESKQVLIRPALDSVDEVLQIVHSMNTVLDIERDKLTLHKLPSSLVSLVASVKGRYEEKIGIEETTWVDEFSHQALPPVEMDVERIRNVLLVLIDNAVRYLNAKNRQIKISLAREDGSVRFEISDNGLGIPQAEQAYVFERFYRASNAQLRHADGMGLGLHLSKAIVEAHGGQMGFESTEGKGSKFWFTLPLTGSDYNA